VDGGFDDWATTGNEGTASQQATAMTRGVHLFIRDSAQLISANVVNARRLKKGLARLTTTVE
jgi:hypothetical protein